MRPDAETPLDHPTPDRPFRVYAALTDHCNRACPWCSTYSSPTGRQWLDPAALRAHLPADGPYELQLEGGEPLTHPRFWDFVDAARADPRCTRLVLCTNGVTVPRSPERLRAFVDRLGAPLTVKLSINHHLLDADPGLLTLAKSLWAALVANGGLFVVNLRRRRGVAGDDADVRTAVEAAGLLPVTNDFFLQRYGLAAAEGQPEAWSAWDAPFIVADRFVLVNPDGTAHGTDLVSRSEAMRAEEGLAGPMQILTDGTYDEALERLHRTGPEFKGWLSNHGPMVVEALARRGGADIHRWTDTYTRRLEPLPPATRPLSLETATAALGDQARLSDWIDFFERRLLGRRWQDVLVSWWPVLLPGIPAAATHAVIRVGHATVALRAHENAVRVRELAHGLGYWAALWQPIEVPVPQGTGRAADLVWTVPRVPHQDDGIRERLAQLPDTPSWATHGATLRAPQTADELRQGLERIVDAVVLAYPRIAVGQPTMLVHAATAPNAVARVLPSLPVELWRPSFDAAWAAASAVLAAYRPAAAVDVEVPQPGGGSSSVGRQPGGGSIASVARQPGGVSINERAEGASGASVGRQPGGVSINTWAAAVEHGGEHVLKLADTALDVYERTGDARALAAVATAILLGA